MENGRIYAQTATSYLYTNGIIREYHIGATHPNLYLVTPNIRWMDLLRVVGKAGGEARRGEMKPVYIIHPYRGKKGDGEEREKASCWIIVGGRKMSLDILQDILAKQGVTLDIQSPPHNVAKITLPGGSWFRFMVCGSDGARLEMEYSVCHSGTVTLD